MKYSKNPLTSWIIRTKNEEKWIGKVLEALLTHPSPFLIFNV